MSAVLLGRDDRLARLLPDGAARLSGDFLAVVAPDKLRVINLPGAGGLARLAERLVLPGIQAHYAVRKRYIEERVRDFIDAGGRRVVVLGAGLDTLGLRLARECPRVDVVELDHPATQRRKRLAFDPPSNLVLRPADLARTPVTLDGGGPACFVAEGLTMYLRPGAVAATLRGCARAGGAGSVVIFTFMTPDGRGRIAFRRGRGVGAWLATVGEPFTWGIAAGDLPGFLAPLGLRIREIVGSDELRERYVTPLGIRLRLAEGESVCVCEVDR